MNYIELKNYTKKLKKRLILDNIDLNIKKGSVVGLYGRNASGKTMILRAMAGLILPTTDSIKVNNIHLEGRNRFPESLGLLIESIRFWPNLKAKETLEILTAIQNIVSPEDIVQALERVGLDPEDKRTLKKFSLGMRQKLAIAQAIVEKPDLLLLDEPTNSLDDEARVGFYEIIREEQKRGCTIVMASHILEDLESVCDYLVEIKEGRVILPN